WDPCEPWLPGLPCEPWEPWEPWDPCDPCESCDPWLPCEAGDACWATADPSGGPRSTGDSGTPFGWAWRCSVELRKSAGRFRIGGSFALSLLVIAPSSSRQRQRRDRPQAFGVGLHGGDRLASAGLVR